MVATANARLAGLTRELQEIRQRWIAAGLSGEPEQGLLASQRASLTARDDRLNPVSAALERLTAGYRKWLEDEQLRKLTEDVVGRMKSVQASSGAESLQKLVQRVDQAQQSVEARKGHEEKVEDYGVRMKDQARTYGGEVLVPLNATIKRFARALMTGSETAVTYKAEHHAARSELRPTIVQSDLDGRTRNVEMNPSLYFSEGQLSASASPLCSRRARASDGPAGVASCWTIRFSTTTSSMRVHSWIFSGKWSSVSDTRSSFQRMTALKRSS